MISPPVRRRRNFANTSLIGSAGSMGVNTTRFIFETATHRMPHSCGWNFEVLRSMVVAPRSATSLRLDACFKSNVNAGSPNELNDAEWRLLPFCARHRAGPSGTSALLQSIWRLGQRHRERPPLPHPQTPSCTSPLRRTNPPELRAHDFTSLRLSAPHSRPLRRNDLPSVLALSLAAIQEWAATDAYFACRSSFGFLGRIRG